MVLPNLFSRRKKLAQGGGAVDVYIYDAIPNKLRVQIVQIIQKSLGSYGGYNGSTQLWEYIRNTMREEKGVFCLTDRDWDKADVEYCNWLLREEEIDLFLDGVELSFDAISSKLGEYYAEKYDEYRLELNARFHEAGVGYEIQSGDIIQISNNYTHSQIVIPALTLLHDNRFAGANNEYLDAHKFFRAGDFESCLIECGKAFESVLKVIGTERRWSITPNDTASKLLAATFQSGFVPQYMQAQFTALRAVLESGVPTVRNRMSGHGAGGTVRQVDKHLAAFQLHQTAAAIVFLVEHDQITPK